MRIVHNCAAYNKVKCKGSKAHRAAPEQPWATALTSDIIPLQTLYLSKNIGFYCVGSKAHRTAPEQPRATASTASILYHYRPYTKVKCKVNTIGLYCVGSKAHEAAAGAAHHRRVDQWDYYGEAHREDDGRPQCRVGWRLQFHCKYKLIVITYSDCSFTY